MGRGICKSCRGDSARAARGGAPTLGGRGGLQRQSNRLVWEIARAMIGVLWRLRVILKASCAAVVGVQTVRRRGGVALRHTDEAEVVSVGQTRRAWAKYSVRVELFGTQPTDPGGQYVSGGLTTWYSHLCLGVRIRLLREKPLRRGEFISVYNIKQPRGIWIVFHRNVQWGLPLQSVGEATVAVRSRSVRVNPALWPFRAAI